MEFELWIRMIKESIEKKKIDPWNINIAEIADLYMGKIKEFKRFDIRLSADVILVGGILLRMKSEVLYGECEVVNEEEYEKALEIQVKAVINLLKNRVGILTGPAGTGKTTVIKTIVELMMAKLGLNKIYILTPTGKSAMVVNKKLNNFKI